MRVARQTPLVLPALPSAHPTVEDQFLAPVWEVLRHHVRQRLDCPVLSDAAFLRLGCRRVLSQAESGRDFLQQEQEHGATELQRANFFAVLHSARRQALLHECATQLYCEGSRRLRQDGADLLAAFPRLHARAVWAVDGHQIEHATHALRDPKGAFVAPKSLYLLCLHTGLVHNLSPVQGEGIYRHELPVLRERLPAWLQRHRPAGKARAPILVGDLAYVDKQFWTQMKLLGQAGAVVITRTKDNMRPIRYGAQPWQTQAPINLGVQADELVGFDGSICMRLVTYVDPETGERYEFLTTEMDLEPGLIAWLYLLRWRIEKVFDTGKNKLQETKAWATGTVAQAIQGHFFALTHNLLILFRQYLLTAHGLQETKLIRKREQWLKWRAEQAAVAGRQVHPLHAQMPPVVQLTLQFIRCLRNHMAQNALLAGSLDRFQAMLESYL
jgi:hypothetical protein